MRNAKGIETLKSMKYLASVPDGETIVGLAVNDGVLFVGTDRHIYRLVDEKFLEREDGKNGGNRD